VKVGGVGGVREFVDFAKRVLGVRVVARDAEEAIG